jgi:NADH dehydrogenase
LADSLDSPKDRLGRVKVRPTLQLPDHDDVFVIGDATYWEEEGQPLPMVAPAAIQQAEVAAKNVLCALKGTDLQRFEYKDPGSLATIGRNAAVAQVGRFKLRGFPAWLVWLVIHIMRLIGFRNRLIVLINWAWDYLFYDRAVRLIMPEGCWPWTKPEDGEEEPAGDEASEASTATRL